MPREATHFLTRVKTVERRQKGKERGKRTEKSTKRVSAVKPITETIGRLDVMLMEQRTDSQTADAGASGEGRDVRSLCGKEHGRPCTPQLSLKMLTSTT